MKRIKGWQEKLVKCSVCKTPKSAAWQHEGSTYCDKCKAIKVTELRAEVERSSNDEPREWEYMHNLI